MMQPRDKAIADALAYVDDCLPPDRRADFERLMADDHDIAERVSTWRAQNAAIRAAFADGPSRQSRAAGREAFPRTSDPGRAARFVEELRRGARSVEQTALEKAPAAPARPKYGATIQRRLRRKFVTLLAASFLCAASVDLSAGDRATRFADAAFTAYRTYANGRVQAVEIATNDATALERWLKAQLAAAIAVPKLDDAGFALVGGRVTPGVERPAAFVLYQNGDDERVGLIIEPGESAPSREAFASTRDDVAALTLPALGPSTLTIVGRVDAPRLETLARIADTAPDPP